MLLLDKTNNINYMKNIVIIPARGNSKRLPGKNIRLLGEYPLLVHSILYAKNHDFVDEIIVSTNDELIKKIAIEYGAKVIDRPSHLCKDQSSTVSALKHVIENINEVYDNIILLQPTNPLRPNDLLTNAFEVYLKGDFDSLITVSRNYHKLGKIIDNKFEPFNYEIGQRSQDLKPLYFENGLLYISKRENILNNKILGKHNFPYVVNHLFSEVDIDTNEDFVQAEFIYKTYKDET
jgi:CMP-N-acetylneuraminic acid synthetase|tara:strand:- start:524 stop:1228 length:705 start_codon:yes stop_codon:yes gene_type:complete